MSRLMLPSNWILSVYRSSKFDVVFYSIRYSLGEVQDQETIWKRIRIREFKQGTKWSQHESKARRERVCWCSHMGFKMYTSGSNIKMLPNSDWRLQRKSSIKDNPAWFLETQGKINHGKAKGSCAFFWATGSGWDWVTILIIDWMCIFLLVYIMCSFVVNWWNVACHPTHPSRFFVVMDGRDPYAVQRCEPCCCLNLSLCFGGGKAMQFWCRDLACTPNHQDESKNQSCNIRTNMISIPQTGSSHPK